MERRCARCGGTGRYSKGNVINGVCFGCMGSGLNFPAATRRPRSRKIVQYVLVDANGHHLAINTDKAVLESLKATIANALDIEEIAL